MKLLEKNFKQYKEIMSQIKKYKNIVIYRHVSPDFDACGCQHGLYTYIKDNFADKNVYMDGDDFKDFTPVLFPPVDKSKLENLKDYLAIVVDVSNSKRIDGETIKNASYVIKIDHHPNVEPFAQLNLVNDELVSCSELLLDFMIYFEKKYPVSPLVTKYLYIGITGDSGRFMYQATSSHTLECGAYCYDKSINPYYNIYQPMYEKDLHSIEVKKFIFNNFVSNDLGLIYYIFSNDNLIKYGLTADEPKLYINEFSNLKEVEVWVSITEDVKQQNWRVSVRSKRVPINGICENHHGGGHEFASGAKLFSEKEISVFIEELNNLLKEYKNATCQ